MLFTTATVHVNSHCSPYQRDVRVWAISDETPGSVTKGVYLWGLRRGIPTLGQQLTAYLHMLSLRIVSIQSSKPINFSNKLKIDVAPNDPS